LSYFCPKLPDIHAECYCKAVGKIKREKGFSPLMNVIAFEQVVMHCCMSSRVLVDMAVVIIFFA